MAFEAVRRADGGMIVLELHGELDTVSAPLLDRTLDELATETSTIVIDLAALAYINSTGVRSFLRIVRQLRGSDGDLVFVATPPKIVRVFQYCGLYGYFRFEAGTEAIAVPGGAR